MSKNGSSNKDGIFFLGIFGAGSKGRFFGGGNSLTAIFSTPSSNPAANFS
jgi:hypothetical protein